MIGNDIIDIAFTKKMTNWKRRGFLDKVFNPKEQEIIKASGSEFLTVWTLWSMKESAYKINLRNGGEVFRNPLRIKIVNFTENTADVNIDNENYTCNTDLHSTYIYTEASTGLIDTVGRKIITLDSNNPGEMSCKCRQVLMKKVSDSYSIDERYLKFRKEDNGVPYVYYKNRKLDCDLSLSHHGRYGAVVVGYV